jgi:hypothetical protein
MLEPKMHGFLLNYKLYEKLRAITQPVSEAEITEAKLKKEMEKLETKIIVDQTKPRINKQFAKFLKEQKEHKVHQFKITIQILRE